MFIKPFMDWCHKQDPAVGTVIFVVTFTVLCCTGAMIGILLAELVFNKE